jgi:predicted dehydrogenase
MTASELRIGIIGLGVISRYYLAALDQLPALRLRAVCDIDEAVLEPLAGRARRHRDHRALLADADVDAVVVNVPNDAHFVICRDAIEAGLAVCVEKPLATTLEEGRELVRLAESRSVPLFTAFHRRYNANVRELRQRVGSRAVADVTVRYLERIEDHAGQDRWYLDPARCGGGCVADNGPNAFDLVRIFLGDVGVTRAEVVRDAAGVDRQADVTLAAAAGGVARVELDWSFPGERKDLQVRLADGTLLAADMLTGYAEFKGSLWHEYVGVLEDFHAVVTEGARNGAAGTGGLAALALVRAVYQAEGAGVEQVRRLV